MKPCEETHASPAAGTLPRSQPAWEVRPLPLLPKTLFPLSYSFTARVCSREVNKPHQAFQCSFCSEKKKKSMDHGEHVTWLGTSTVAELRRGHTVQPVLLLGEGMTVFLDLPNAAKTSSVWRCRTGLLACVTEASCLKLRQHMLEVLICC